MNLQSALDLTLPLPSSHDNLSRWFAEPVSHIFIPSSTFISNAKGYPVLPKGTQVFLQNLMKASKYSRFTCYYIVESSLQGHPVVILSGAYDRLHPRGTEDKYVDYIRFLEKSSSHVKRAKETNTLENYAQGYQDYLQMPLQVCIAHLSTSTHDHVLSG